MKQNGPLIRIFSEENGGPVPAIPAKIKSFAPNLEVNSMYSPTMNKICQCRIVDVEV
jgi:hypothetical protein